MKQIVTEPALSEKRSDEQNVFSLVNQLRAVAVLRSQTRVRGTSDGAGTWLTLWADTIPQNASVMVTADVVGRGASEGAAYTITAGVQNFAGVVTVIGGTAQVTFQREDNAAMDVQFNISGEDIQLQVRDDAVQAMAWRADVFVSVTG